MAGGDRRLVLVSICPLHLCLLSATSQLLLSCCSAKDDASDAADDDDDDPARGDSGGPIVGRASSTPSPIPAVCDWIHSSRTKLLQGTISTVPCGTSGGGPTGVPFQRDRRTVWPQEVRERRRVMEPCGQLGRGEAAEEDDQPTGAPGDGPGDDAVEERPRGIRGGRAGRSLPPRSRSTPWRRWRGSITFRRRCPPPRNTSTPRRSTPRRTCLYSDYRAVFNMRVDKLYYLVSFS